MNRQGAKRCVCGHSTHYPICDGSHAEEGWSCVAESVEMVRDAFVASRHLTNLANRLANRFKGTSLHELTGPVRARRVFILTDGVDLEGIAEHLEDVHAESTFVIGVGIEEAALSWAFADAQFAQVPAEPHTILWAATEKLIQGDVPWSEASDRPNVFVSHSVDDEGRIFPALTALREQYGLAPFVCADSIEPGANWRDEILNHLKRCDVFLLLSSAAVTQSVYCAYETGVATGLGKAIRVVNLDGSALPMHLADTQAVDIPRLRQRKPWLDEGDAILDALLTAISSAHA